MALAAISRQGLTVTAVLVALLWACIGMERWSVHQTNQAYLRTLQEMESLQARSRRRVERTAKPLPQRLDETIPERASL